MVIRMKNVSYIRQGKAILDDISWTVKPGEMWAILGLNGAGKSTLLRILLAEFWKSAGDLEVLGVPFGTGDIPSLREKIGIVSSFLVERFPTDLTAEQIVLTGAYKSTILYREYGDAELAVAKDMLLSIGGGDLIGRLYSSLSQGERQLLLIARSLMGQPAILVLDEATVGLDLLARERLLQHIHLICQLDPAPTILHVTHHAEEITADFSHVLLLKDGKVLQKGRKEDVLTPPILSDFYGSPIELIPLGEERLFIKPRLTQD